MASHQYIYVIKGLKKVYGSREVIKDLYLSFYPGAKIGILGHNGSGKSTLLKIMAGVDKDFTGEAWAADGVKIGYLAQEPQLDASKDVYNNILDAVAEKRDLLAKFNEVSARFAEELTDDEMNSLINEQGELQEKIDHLNAWDLEREIQIAMDALRCPPKNSNVETLSGGERRRVALCKLLLSAPDILLLDEPTNHLDAESISWLQEYLGNYAGTVILVTHDRYFLDTVTNWILEMERGEGIPWEGNYSSWLEQKQKRLAAEEKSESSRQKRLSEELEWVKQSPKGRQSKSKARLTAYEELRDKEREKSVGVAQIVIPDGERLGNNVIEGKNLSKSYDGKTLFEDFNFRIVPGAIVGIIGPNGVGKTTLFRMITGQETPDNGEISIGESVNLGYVDQSRDSLKAESNVWQEISDGLEEIQLGKHMVKSRAYCSAFNFKGSDQQKIVGSLSGGERNRVHLAKMLKGGANVMLLDEPTNDLDIDTLRALEEALLEFAGCAIIISHDRWFLDRVATHIIAYENDHVEFYEGNYQDYDQDLRRRQGVADGEVEKYRHKKLVRK
jgi:energy-dependent translational throttle protein EttA